MPKCLVMLRALAAGVLMRRCAHTSMRNPRSVGPRPVLALADEAAERTALELEPVRPLFDDVAAVGLAVFGIVDLPRPLAGAVRLHAQHDRHADQRPAALARIGIVL